MTASLILPLEEKYTDYLRDESALTGCAENISFPSSRDELITVLNYLVTNKKPFTAQGSRTGITGGCVPDHGHILNMSRMNKILGFEMCDCDFSLKVEPGVRLFEINQCLYNRSFYTQGWSEFSLAAYRQFRKASRQFFPPNPTESTATIGGMFFNNASGPNARHYGKTSAYITSLSLVLPNLEEWDIRRGQYVFELYGCRLPNGHILNLQTVGQGIYEPLAAYPGLDLIDFLAGSEGMLCLAESLTLRLLPEPEKNWGVIFMFKSYQIALKFSKIILAQEFKEVFLTTIEYMDKCTLDLIMELKKTVNSLSGTLDIPSEIQSCVYIELVSHTPEDEYIEKALFSLLELFTDCDGDPNHTFAADTKDAIEKFRLFRHAAPEAVNRKISISRVSNPSLVKTATDFTVPNQYFDEVFDMYYSDIHTSCLQAAVFGHMDQCHVHVNFLPSSIQEMVAAQILISNWAKKIISWGGCLAEENGIGKLKIKLIKELLPETSLQRIGHVKKSFDPDGLLNPRNLLI